MTKKAKRKLKGLLTRKRDTRFSAPADDPGKHVLDTATEVDLEAMDPRRSPFLQAVTARIDQALAKAGALNSDTDPLLILCDAANLTVAEYEAVVMQADGLSWEWIARAQRVSVNAAKLAGRRGLRKLREYVLISPWTPFSHGLIEEAMDVEPS
jgi:DNA-directed RNA polymerase specialized sigma24 family protein